MRLTRHLLRFANLHIFLVSFFLALAATALLGLEQMLGATESTLRDSMNVTAFLQPAVSDEDGQKVADAIKADDAQVESAQFTGRNAALARAQQDPLLSKSLMLLKDNPLPGFVTIRFSDAAWLERMDPSVTLSKYPQIQDVRWNAPGRMSFRSTIQWRRWIMRMGFGLLALIFLWCIAGVYQTLSARLSLGAVLTAVAVGILGAAGAVGLWVWTLQRLGPDAAIIRPGHLSLLPILSGIIVGMALSGWGELHDA